MCIKKLDQNKRDFMKKSLALVFCSNAISFNIHSKEESSYILNGPLAGNIYYTKNRPGRWSNILDSHVPEIIENNNILEISTLHEMRGYEHYIIKHLVLDNKLNIISEKRFDPSKDAPVSRHNITGYLDKVYILSVCNQHDTWLNSFDL